MQGANRIAMLITIALKMDRKMARKRRRKKQEPRANPSPDQINALVNLYRSGQMAKAEQACRELLHTYPQSLTVLNALGASLTRQGQLLPAVQVFDQMIRLQPDYAEAYNNRGAALQELGQLEEAVDSYSQAIKIQPDYAQAYYNRGNALRDFGQLEIAVDSYNQAIELQPDYTQAYSNRGNALRDLGQLGAAVDSYSQAIKIQPDYAQAYCNRGNALRDLGQLEEAVDSCNRAIQLQPDYTQAYSNRGNALQDLGQLRAAVGSYNRAIELQPDYAEAYNNRGNALAELGQLEAAMASYDQAIELKPDYVEAYSNLIFSQDFLSSMDLIQQQKERQLWDQRFIQPLPKCHSPHPNHADSERSLRIGYLSADFKRHSAAQGFADLILSYDVKQFQVYCYSGIRIEKGDGLTVSFQHQASVWRSIQGSTDTALAEQIRQDQIDILVDLSGHTAGNRLLTLGYKPAPIQVSGIGHNPPGLSTIDYRLTNRFSTFPEEELLFPEQPIYLDYATGFHLYQIQLTVSPLPAKGNGFLTFGCLNRWAKVSSTTLALWSRLLLAIPNSRLILKASQLANESLQASILGQMKASGVSEERIDLRGGSPQQDHLAVYQEIDISLDPFPHGGGITSLESAWMGVPVISLYGDRVASRAGATTLSPLGLGDWLATGESEYIELAQDWNQRLEELEQLRLDLRPRVEEQAKVFPGQVEEAYRRIWQRWCRGEKASPLNVSQNGKRNRPIVKLSKGQTMQI